jgi:glucose 1-dehydrogenase
MDIHPPLMEAARMNGAAEQIGLKAPGMEQRLDLGASYVTDRVGDRRLNRKITCGTPPYRMCRVRFSVREREQKMRFADKAALVCGGTSGIGLGCARRLAREGARVVVSGSSASKGTKAEIDLRKESLDVKFIQGDISDPTSIVSLVGLSIEHLARIDVLICSAGAFGKPRSFVETPTDDFDYLMNLNLRGPFILERLVAAKMIESDTGGSIVNISSVAGTLAIPTQTGYCVSKAGLNMLTKVMSLSLAPHGIRVNSVAPGAISTEMLGGLEQKPEWRKFVLGRTPLGRTGKIDEVASAVAFLASDDSSYITGHTLFVEGGRMALNYTMTEKPLF